MREKIKRIVIVLVALALGSLPWIGFYFVVTEDKHVTKQVQNQTLEIENLEDNVSDLQANVKKMKEFINGSIYGTNKYHEVLEFDFDPEKGE